MSGHMIHVPIGNGIGIAVTKKRTLPFLHILFVLVCLGILLILWEIFYLTDSLSFSLFHMSDTDNSLNSICSPKISPPFFKFNTSRIHCMEMIRDIAKSPQVNVEFEIDSKSKEYKFNFLEDKYYSQALEKVKVKTPSYIANQCSASMSPPYLMSSNDTIQCLQNQWIFIVGDSSMRFFFSALTELLWGSPFVDISWPSHRPCSEGCPPDGHAVYKRANTNSTFDETQRIQYNKEYNGYLTTGYSNNPPKNFEECCQHWYLGQENDGDMEENRERMFRDFFIPLSEKGKGNGGGFLLRVTFIFKTFSNHMPTAMTSLMNSKILPSLIIFQTGAWDNYKGIPVFQAAENAKKFTQWMKHFAPSVPLLWFDFQECNWNYGKEFNDLIHTYFRQMNPPIPIFYRSLSTQASFRSRNAQFEKDCEGWHSHDHLQDFHVQQFLQLVCHK